MTNKEFILELIRMLRPKYFNKITWLLVVSGIALISPPLITILINIFVKSVTKYNLIGENDILWGFLLIFLGLFFNILSQILNGKSTIRINFICNRGGNVTINQPTIVVTDEQKAQEIINALSKSNQSTKINYSKSNFTSNFSELFKGLPWVKNISLEKIEEYLEYYRIDYETSNSIAEHFFINLYNETQEQLTVKSLPQMEINNIPNLAIIYWEKYGYWTLNTYQLFNKNKLSFNSAIKSDISNIIGDLTFILTDLKIKLTYDSTNSDSSAIQHQKYGSLQKVELIKSDQSIEMNFLELGIIDSYVDMKVVGTEQNENLTEVSEQISYPHIFKLSTLMIRFLLKSDLSYDFKNTLIVRKSIIEFMKKIDATKSYAIPSTKSNQTDILFKQAFDDSWVYKRYKKSK